MPLRLVAGRAGSGKTTHCLDAVRRRLAESRIRGPRLLLIVPEQAALQTERALLERSPYKTLGRCEVLGFRRLARRILDSVTSPLPRTISATGREMILRRLISRHRRELGVFAAVADKPGFVPVLADAFGELLQHAVRPDRLRSAAPADHPPDDTSVRVIQETAALFDRYEAYLGTEAVDPDALLTLAARHVHAADWLNGAQIWLDGFAGLTPQQLELLTALAAKSAEMEVALLLDPASPCIADPNRPEDPVSTFERVEATWREIARAVHAAGVAIAPPVLLNQTVPHRFVKNPDLARLERDLFHVEVRRDLSPVKELLLPAASPGKPGAEAPALRLLCATDVRAEVEAAAREIHRLCVTRENPLRFRDVAIICRSLEPYHDLLSAALAAHDIPFFIDRRRPTAHHPLVELVRAALGLLDDARFADAAVALLKSGLTPLSEDDCDGLENFLLARGIHTAAAWHHPEWRPRGAEIASRRLCAAASRSRDQLVEALGAWWPRERRTDARMGSEWARDLADLLERLRVAERLSAWSDAAAQRGDLDEAQEHHQIWNDVVDLLEDFSEALGDEPLTPRACAEALETALGGFSLGLVPPTLDQVLVGAIDRSRQPSVAAAFLLGWSEGMFPQPPQERQVFGDRERDLLERAGVHIGPGRASRLRDERMLAYVAVTRASQSLWISYPASGEKGREAPPSPYLDHVRAALPHLPLERLPVESDVGASIESASTPRGLVAALAASLQSRSEQVATATKTLAAIFEAVRRDPAMADELNRVLAAGIDPASQRLTPADLAELATPPYTTSVSRLETLALCPFQHFVKHVLGLRPREVHEIGPPQIGTIAHRMLEHFFNDLIARGTTLAQLSEAEVAASLERIPNDVLPLLAEETVIDEPLLRSISRQVRRELDTPLTSGHVQPPHLTTMRTELVFGGPDAEWPALRLTTPRGHQVELVGKIDRIDVVRRGDTALGVVCDYKRRGGRMDLTEVYHGLALQLFAYLLVLREHGSRLNLGTVTPAAGFLIPLIGRYKSVDHPSGAASETSDPFRSFIPRGLIDFDAIADLDPSLTRGGKSRHFNVALLKESGGISNAARSDALPGPGFRALLELVHRRLGELMDRWIDGDIEVRPTYFNRSLPCQQCDYAAVCRFEAGRTPLLKIERKDRPAILLELGSAEQPDEEPPTS